MSAALALVPAPTWPQVLVDLMAATGTSQSALARATGIPRTTVNTWLSTNGRPTLLTWPRLRAWVVAQGEDPGTFDQAIAGTVHDLPPAGRPGRARSTPSGSTSSSSTTPPGSTDPDMQIFSQERLTPEELAHFQLAEDPFEDPVSPEDIYLPQGLASVETTMLRAIQARKIVAVTGPAGSGKSALLRRLWARSRGQKKVRLIAPALMDRQRVTLATLTVAILRDLLERDTSSMAAEARAQLLRKTLADQVDAGLYPVLFIDEAHDLRDTALIAIKRLWDSHTLFRQISILMVGQPPLTARLRGDPTLAELTGRTQIIELPAWGAEAVAGYLEWRFSRVHADLHAIFDTPALRALAVRADRPLWINNLSVLAMRQARLIGDERVAANHVGRA